MIQHQSEEAWADELWGNVRTDDIFILGRYTTAEHDDWFGGFLDVKSC